MLWSSILVIIILQDKQNVLSFSSVPTNVKIPCFDVVTGLRYLSCKLLEYAKYIYHFSKWKWRMHDNNQKELGKFIEKILKLDTNKLEER